MKSIILVIILVAPSVFAKSVTIRRIEDLERRVTILERKIASMGATSTSGLKTKSVNSVKKSNTPRLPAATSANNAKIPKAMQKDLQKNIKKIKENRSKSQEIIDDIMENY